LLDDFCGGRGGRLGGEAPSAPSRCCCSQVSSASKASLPGTSKARSQGAGWEESLLATERSAHRDPRPPGKPSGDPGPWSLQPPPVQGILSAHATWKRERTRYARTRRASLRSPTSE